MEEAMQNNKISYEFAQEFSDSFADLNALYHTIDKLESRIWGLVKWMRHSISDQQYKVMQLRYAPHEKGGRSTLEETGNQLGLTKQRVQQIEKQTLQKLGINLYKTQVIYARGGRDDGAGKRAAVSSTKLKRLPQE